METLDSIVEELKELPPARLQEAASYIHRLRQESQAERIAILRQTAGSLTPVEADSWAKAVQDCERIDASGW